MVSWLILRGNCRGCGDRIPGFHPVVELITPLLFLGAVWSIGSDWRLLPALWLIPVGVSVSAIDLRTMIVPTRIVWPAFFVSVALSVVAAVAEGEWLWLRNGVIGILVLAGPLFVLWFLLPKSMGFGDVRLATLLGFSIGFFSGVRPMGGVALAVCALGLASILGLTVGIVALGARGRKAQVPFGPSMVASAFICIALASQILEPFGQWGLTHG